MAFTHLEKLEGYIARVKEIKKEFRKLESEQQSLLTKIASVCVPKTKTKKTATPNKKGKYSRLTKKEALYKILENNSEKEFSISEIMDELLSNGFATKSDRKGFYPALHSALKELSKNDPQIMKTPEKKWTWRGLIATDAESNDLVE